ncbi:MAG: zinc ABC transporter substrate-binding protein [Myxococcales bacterium]|nr:zinc ABC transporter substrate-binding protein [Myxococcales bacterium]
MFDARSTRSVAALAVLALSLAGCPKRGTTGKPRVAVSIFPLYDAARRVAGDRLDVVLVLPPGRSEHSYDPTPREMARIAGSQLALSVGLGMDEWLSRIVRNAGGDNVRVVELGPSLDPRALTHEEVGEEAADEAREAASDGGHAEEEHHHGPKDPHFWLDPTRMARAATIMAREFARIDPQGAAGFEQRQARFGQEMTALDTRIRARADRWSKRTIVTFHGSMGYYAERYRLTIAAVIEPFPGREPTARYISEVLAAVQQSHAAALFSEPQLDRHPAEVIAEQSRVPLFEVDPVGGTPGRDTYERLLVSNTEVFERALR